MQKQIEVEEIIQAYRDKLDEVHHELIMMTAYAKTLEKRLAESVNTNIEEENGNGSK